MAASQGRQTNQKAQAEGYARAGAAALAVGDLAQALTGYFHALALAPRNPGYLHTTVALIGVTDGYVLPPVIKAILADAADSPDFDCQPLSTAVRSGIVGDPLGQEVLALVQQGGGELEAALAGPKFDAVLNDRLLRAVLRRSVINSPELETLAAGLRRHALERVSAAQPTALLEDKLDLLVSVALQCFNAVYAFQVSDQEGSWLAELTENGLPDDPALLAVLGAYRPLFECLGDAPLPKLASGSPLADLFRRQIVEPRREAKLRTEFPCLPRSKPVFRSVCGNSMTTFPIRAGLLSITPGRAPSARSWRNAFPG